MLVPVDELPRDMSVYGVHGMGGNSRNWVSTEVVEGREGRAMRGGAWNLHPVNSRCAYRARLDATNVRDNLGFRVAWTPRASRALVP
jgi:formylglycine-generating enzyme required for sulfatase activity